MIVRKIRPEEYRRVRQFCALAFECKWEDGDRDIAELLRRAAEAPESRQEAHWDSQWAAFEDDDKTMLSTFSAIPFRANFDGGSVMMMGIGGVATLPQYRRCGGIRRCFERALPDMYAQGAAFSYLYPFSTAFYRKFGYELGCERDRYKLRLSHMPRFPVGGSCALLEQGQPLKADIRRVYEAWQSRYNLMTVDEDIEYQWTDRADPYRDMEYTFVYKSPEGAPKGVVTYRPVIDAGDRTLECTRFFFTDAEGFCGLMNLLMTLSADHSHAVLHLPTDIELGQLLPEWSFGAVEQRRLQAGMVRAVNVEKVLAAARARGSGRLTLRVTDGQICQNNGSFRVTFDGGRVTEVLRDAPDAPDVSLTIQDFSRLICGRYDLESAAAYLPDIVLNSGYEKASCLFYRKPMYISRYF